MLQPGGTRNSPLADQAVVAVVRQEVSLAVAVAVGPGWMRDGDSGKIGHFGNEPRLGAVGQVTVRQEENRSHKANGQPHRFEYHREAIGGAATEPSCSEGFSVSSIA